jgi:hypothetical protein
MKRISIALLLGTCVLPAMAGEIKIHNWPTTYIPQLVATIDVQMNVGYYIHIIDQKALTVVQDTQANDPYHTYVGCKSSEVETNFPCILSAEATATSPAGGTWVPSINPEYLPIGTSTIDICVVGYNVKIEELVGGAKNLKVAEISIFVLPE